MADIGAEDMASKKLTELRVVDLKIELEKRSLEKTGVKQALLERLKKAMTEEGLDLECHLFQVATPSSVKISKKSESFQERTPNREDVHSDTSELISLGYETDEKDISLEICHIIDEDNQEPEEDYCQTEHLMTKDTKCEEEDILDEDLSYHEDDPVKLCINENPCQSPEAIIECTLESISSQKKDSPPPIIEPTIPLESKEVDLESETATPLLSNQIASPSFNQSEKTSEDKTSKGEGVIIMQRNTTPTTEEKHDTDKDELKFPHPQNSSKPSEVQLGSSDTAKNEKSSNQNPKLHPKEVNVGGRNLWVSGLSSSTRATDLKNLFSKYGKVTGAKVVTNAKSPGSKCYGFVTMTSTDEASKCIQHLHRTELHGRIISVERAKADPSQVTIDKISNQASDKGKGNVERSRTDSASKSSHRTMTHEITKEKEKKEANDKPSSTDRKRERSPIRTTRRTSREVDSRDILTLEKIREERERERIKNWERTKRKDERKQQMMLQRERNRQRDVERMQREEAERLAKEREKLRLEKQRLELDRLKAERERVALEREKQRRERERLEEEREERRRELQRRGTKRPADSSSYWSESKRTAISPHSMRVHQRAGLTQRESYKREERIKHPEKISSRRDVEVILDHAKTSRKQSSPKIAWRPFGRSSTSPARRHSSRDGVQYVGENQNWHSSSSANRSRAYDNSYGQHWTDTRELLSSSRTWSSSAVPSNLGSLTSSGNVLMSSSGRIHTDATRYDGYKNVSSRRY